MAARTPRRSFATPFVVTLAAAPACYVQSSPAPQGSPPPQPPPQTAEPSQPPPAQPGGPVIVNPPMPTNPSTQPSTPPPQPPAQPPAQNQAQKWTVFKAQDGGCMAAFKVECQPKATCNPPPPFKYACPENVSLEKPITVATYDGTSCFVEFEAPKCPPKTACNPPRPRPVTCPKR